ncbi:unnamed protein product [Mucor hiemalis]
MASERISQILPTVKCSDCGRDVLIRRLGDHLCSSQPPVPSLPIIPAMKDKYKMQNQPNNPISPLQSPNHSGPKYHPYVNTGGNVTPPYYNKDQQRPLMKDVYADDSDHFYKSGSNSTIDLPRKNSTSPAPSSPVYRQNNDSNSDFNTRYEGTRKQSLGNIYNQQKYSHSTPTSNTGSSGALDNLMADLMNSMNDDIHLSSSYNSPSLSNQCASCNEEFDYRDDVKKAGQKCYHKACFVCRLCSSPFDQRRTHHEHEGQLYCERDFHVVKNRIMCGACDRVIPPNTAPIKALGKFYHPGHIKCYHCLCPIDGSTGWKEHQGRVYCRSDFKALFLPKCKSCHGTIEKNAVSAMDGKLNGKWHLECFGCHTCHRPFPDNTFYVFDDLPYCKRHYHELNNSLCRQCSEPIEGQCAQTNENWRFHPNCFGCSVCHYPIVDTYYMYDRRIYCETHIRQLQRQKNIRAEKRKTQFGQI